MVRRPRSDSPGRFFHITNRGIAKRTVFESETDVRFFLAQLARARRRGEIRVHNYAIEATHYHLLVESAGKLSEAMHRVDGLYARRFNRGRKRDGSLLADRYWSRPILGDVDRLIVARYIDHNPRKDGLAVSAGLYPYCSAYHFVHGTVPRWLERDWTEAVTRDRAGVATFSAEAYLQVFGKELPDSIIRLVLARVRGAHRGTDSFNLVHATSERIQRWMRWKARLADQTAPGLPVVDIVELLRVAQRHRETFMTAMDWECATVGLGRDLSAATLKDLAVAIGQSVATAHRRAQEHMKRVREDPAYCREVAVVARAALDAQYEGFLDPAPAPM